MNNGEFNTSIERRKLTEAQHLITSSFDDYLAARVLINSRLIAQGVMLASTSIEKYLKAFLKILKVSYKPFHLDNIPKAQKYFDNTAYKDVFSYFDPNFLDILSRSYKWRYYDNIEAPESIGFFPNQFLGELDFVFSRLETMIKLPPSYAWKSKYQREVEAFRKELFENNYVLARLDRVTYMKLPDFAFGIYYNPISQLNALATTVIKIKPEYHGTLFLVNIDEKAENVAD